MWHGEGCRGRGVSSAKSSKRGPVNEQIRNRALGATQRARRLRRESGVSERVLWGIVRNKKLGFLFRRQVPVGNYTLDFYCSEAKLCVEVDGEIHQMRLDRDAERDQALAELGIHTVRVPSLLLFEGSWAEVKAFFGEVTSLCEARSGRKASPR